MGRAWCSACSTTTDEVTMSKKILYFTAGDTPTSAELAEITALNAIAAAPYTVQVVNGKAKAALTAVTLSAAAADNSINDAGATITASTISASSTDNSLNDSGNGFVTAGFLVGDYVTIAGFTGDTSNNSGTRRITSVTAAKMVLSGTALVTDAAGESVTVSAPGRFLLRGFEVGDVVAVYGFTGNVANNAASRTITSVTATKMIFGGTDGDDIVNDAAGESVTVSTIETAKYGYGYSGGDVLVADYVAGTVPASYRTDGTAIYTVLSPTAPPRPDNLPATQTVVSNAGTIELDTAGTVTLTVAEGAITAADVGATESVVTDGDMLTVGGETVTLAVAAHVLSGSLAATRAVVHSTQEIAITSGTGTTRVTLTIAGGAITACVLS